MGLLSFLQRSPRTPVAPTPAPDAVSAARIRARRRLIGATVLLALGIVGFPLLFETQPRPIPADIAIELPRKDAQALPTAPAPAPMASAPAAVLSDARPDVVDEPATAVTARAVPGSASAANEISERADEQGRERVAPPMLKPPQSTPPSAPPIAAVVAALPPTKPPASAHAPAAGVTKPAAPASKPAAPAKPASATAGAGTESARARALLDGHAAASAPAARVVVQVGAFTDPDKLREARQKVEKLGFKTYTQVVAVEGGKRTRVRIGPFASRAEADKAALRLKHAGLSPAILTL